MKSRFISALVLCMFSQQLSADTATLTVNQNGTWGKGLCGQTITITARGNLPSENLLELYTTDPPTGGGGASPSVCPSTPSGGQGKITVSRQKKNNDVEFSAQVVGIIGTAVCTVSPAKGSTSLCLYSLDKIGGVLNSVLGGITISYDTRPLSASLELKPKDQSIEVTVQPSRTNISNYTVCYGKSSIGNFAAAGCDTASFQEATYNEPNFTLDSLENWVEYNVKVKATDAAGDQSAWSDVQTATPAPIKTPIGDTDLPENPFSCQSTNSPSSLLSFAVVALFVWRPRRKISLLFNSSMQNLVLVVVMFGALFSDSALSDAGQINLSLQGSPYIPNIDGSKKADGSVTDKKIYGDYFYGSWLPLMGLDFNVHLTDAFGSLQLGMSANYTLARGTGRVIIDDSGTLGDRTGAAGLHILQLRPHLIYVFDPYLEYFPFAPFIRVGLVSNGYLWTYDGGLDKSGTGNDIRQNPAGARFGYELAAGLDFMLDVLEPNVAGRARSRGVYEHTFLRAEIAYMPIDNFGSPGFNFSPTGLFGTSLPLLLTGAIVVEFQ